MPHDKIIVLVTEANTKNSIVVQSQLSNQQNIVLIGQGLGSLSIAKSWGYCSTYINKSLEEVLKSFQVDFIIPIGGKSVKYVSKYYPHKAFISGYDTVMKALNKADYSWLLRLGIRMPRTIELSEFLKVVRSQNTSKFVLKSNDEAKQKYEPVYLSPPFDINSINRLVESKGGRSNVLIQEYVEGEARGFFGLCNTGSIIDFYMHKRLREIPHTGGSSTACCSIYDQDLLDIARSIIKDLGWTGPIMLEFKYNAVQRQYFLIEINPKYWGSLELSEVLGKKWALDSLEIFKYGKVIESKIYQENIKFYWPLDGDIVTIFKGRTFKDLILYLKGNVNLPKENFRSFLYKMIWTILKLIR